MISEIADAFVVKVLLTLIRINTEFTTYCDKCTLIARMISLHMCCRAALAQSNCKKRRARQTHSAVVQPSMIYHGSSEHLARQGGGCIELQGNRKAECMTTNGKALQCKANELPGNSEPECPNGSTCEPNLACIQGLRFFAPQFWDRKWFQFWKPSPGPTNSYFVVELPRNS